MKTQSQAKHLPPKTPYDRRHRARTSLGGCSLFYLSKGLRIAIPLIDTTQKGARVILPRQLSHRSTVTLVCQCARVEFLAEYKVVWRQVIAGGKAIAGLHSVFEGKRKAA